VYGASAITAVTAQNTKGVSSITQLSPQVVDQQIDAVASDLKIDAIKTGMLGSTAIIEAVITAIKRHSLAPIVVDPVMIAKTGAKLIDDDAIKSLGKLLKLAAIVTPNRHEAARLLDQTTPITDVFGATEAAKEICKRFGARACVVKGIQRPNGAESEAVDVYFDGEKAHELASAWRTTTNTHGSGCAFSAAITGALAKGEPIDQAVRTAKNLVAEAIRQATDLGGGGHSPVNVISWLKVKK
jgi:hydroxymethylpyrimidine/phosphomethylpyrimidine kinase